MLKHSENLEKKDKMKFDLYKILRMSVLLSQDQVDELTLNKFKDASLNIDNMLNEEYNSKLEEMFYDTSTLDEEEKRLKELVAFVKERIEQRKSLLDDYRTATSKSLDNLEYIQKSNDLDLYEKRLQLIKDYIENSKLVEVNENDLEVLKNELVKEYDIKSTNELKNLKIEEELYNTFVNVLYEMDLYSQIELSNIDEEIEEIGKEIRDAKDQKDTFVTAFDNLKSSGITGDLELEYASYVENAKRNYYFVKEKEIILKLYKLIAEKESEYSNLFTKRENVKELLHEKTILRTELGIKEKDNLLAISDLINDQKQEIDNEKNNVDNINLLTERIKLKENRLEELKRSIKKPEVLSILKEYSLIDTYDHDDVFEEESQELVEEEVTPEVDVSFEKFEEPKEDPLNLFADLIEETESFEEETEIEPEEVVEKTYEENEIKSVDDVLSMNYGLSRLKSISVMKRVADMLGVKEIKVSETMKVEEEPKEDNPTKEQNDELFWTPAEIMDINKDIEKTKEENSEKTLDNLFTNNGSNDNIFINNPDNKVTPESIFTDNTPEVNNDIFMNNADISNNIFETNNGDGQIIFPEPVMPEIGKKNLPENKEDKFMWPDDMETFDLNGIFPN